jgi:hypothetical protein
MRLNRRDYILKLAVEISLGSDIPSATDDEYREAAELLRTIGVQVPSFRPVYARLLWLITAVASDEKPKTMGASA